MSVVPRKLLKLPDSKVCPHPLCTKPKATGRSLCMYHDVWDTPKPVPEAVLPEGRVNIYFIAVHDDELAVKIGKTAGPVVERIAALQTGHFRDLKLLASIPLPEDCERLIHQALNKHWIRGEWFWAKAEVLDMIEAAQDGSEYEIMRLLNKAALRAIP